MLATAHAGTLAEALTRRNVAEVLNGGALTYALQLGGSPGTVRAVYLREPRTGEWKHRRESMKCLRFRSAARWERFARCIEGKRGRASGSRKPTGAYEARALVFLFGDTPERPCLRRRTPVRWPKRWRVGKSRRY